MAEGSSAATAFISSPDDPGIQILLMGRRRSGKSSSGNTILGERKFKVCKRKKIIQADICDAAAQIGGKQVAVIDCPDLLDPDLSKEKLEELKEQLVSRCSAGLSSVLLTVPLEKPLKNEKEILEDIQCLFGPEVQKYVMILFTHENELNQSIDDYLKHKDHGDLQQLVTECGGKIHCFNNKRALEEQKQELLQKIKDMRMENGGKFIMAKLKRGGSKANLVNFQGESPAAADSSDSGAK